MIPFLSNPNNRSIYGEFFNQKIAIYHAQKRNPRVDLSYTYKNTSSPFFVYPKTLHIHLPRKQIDAQIIHID